MHDSAKRSHAFDCRETPNRLDIGRKSNPISVRIDLRSLIGSEKSRHVYTLTSTVEASGRCIFDLTKFSNEARIAFNMRELDLLYVLATFESIRLLASLLTNGSGYHTIQPGFQAHHAGQIQVDILALGSALQHADLLGPTFTFSVLSLQSLFRPHADRVRVVSHPFWEDGVQHSSFLLGSDTLEDELHNMITSAIQAWQSMFSNDNDLA